MALAVATYSMLNPRTSIAVEGGVYATGSNVSGLIIMLYALIKIARKEHTRSK